jgi:antitoxin HicB
MRKNKHRGSDFRDFLKKEKIEEEVELRALKKALVLEVESSMHEEKLKKLHLASKMRTSRAALDRILDSDNTSITLATLHKATHALGRKLNINLCPADSILDFPTLVDAVLEQKALDRGDVGKLISSIKKSKNPAETFEELEQILFVGLQEFRRWSYRQPADPLAQTSTDALIKYTFDLVDWLLEICDRRPELVQNFAPYFSYWPDFLEAHQKTKSKPRDTRFDKIHLAESCNINLNGHWSAQTFRNRIILRAHHELTIILKDLRARLDASLEKDNILKEQPKYVLKALELPSLTKRNIPTWLNEVYLPFLKSNNPNLPLHPFFTERLKISKWASEEKSSYKKKVMARRQNREAQWKVIGKDLRNALQTIACQS